MNIVDLLVMIIVVTILVTISLGVVTYFAYKLRRARRPMDESESDSESWYFIRHEPPATETETVG
jgi:heme/copper-type cytochrome/quinol oxidase subunit 2